MEFFYKLLDKVRDLTMDQIFPLNNDPYEVKSVLKSMGIYVAAIVVAALLWVLLGHIFILGIIIKIIAVVVCLYSCVGAIALAFSFMKYN